MTVALSSQLQTVTQSQLFTSALQVLQSNGFPTQSWQPGGVELTRLQAFTTALASFVNQYIPAYVGGGFIDYAVGVWMDLLLQEFYNLTRNPAVQTVGNITLTAASGVATQTLAAGKLIATFAATGNRYFNQASVTIPVGPGNVVAPFYAENAGASYNDPSNSGGLTLTTPIPGVTLTNPSTTFTGVTHVGSGTGTITPSGSPTAPHGVVISVTATGQLGTAAFSYQLDGGAAVSLGVISSSNPTATIGSTGITVTFANGGSGTSFIQGETYSFTNPGTWITTQGANVETDTAAGARARARWATVAGIPTSGYYFFLATTTPGVLGQVNQCIVVPDANINNKVNVVVAGPGGVLPSATITTLQTFIGPKARGTDNPVVQSPTTLAITLAGTITLASSQAAAAQSAISLAMTNYVNGVGINGTLRISQLIDSIMNVNQSTPGAVIDATGITINGSSSNLTLGGGGSYVLPLLQPLTFTYQTQ